MSETRMVPLSKIKDNPWRDRMRNPIDPDRVEAIAISIGKTKYWMGTYGREVSGGFVELAFGHHRYEAAKAQGLKEIPIILEPFTDGEMLVWMAQENVRGELPVVIEAIAAAVKALGEGKIKIEAPGKDTKKLAIRYAPSFISGKEPSGTVPDRPYTASTVARYLGYVDKIAKEPRKSVFAAFGILERVEIMRLEEGKEKAKQWEKSIADKKVNEALRDISKFKPTKAEKEEKRKIEAAKAAREAEQQRELQRKRKEAEVKAEAERLALVEKLAKAKAEEDKEKAEKIKAKIAAEKERSVEEQLAFDVKAAELEKKVEERKAAEAEKKQKDAYISIKREVERILHKLEGSTATTKEALTAEVKALSHLAMNSGDRERLRQAALNLGSWYTEWVAPLFLPPFDSASKKLNEYRSREESKRRTEEATAERKREREEKKRAKSKK
jgi:hypothetical protein